MTEGNYNNNTFLYLNTFIWLFAVKINPDIKDEVTKVNKRLTGNKMRIGDLHRYWVVTFWGGMLLSQSLKDF